MKSNFDGRANHPRLYGLCAAIQYLTGMCADIFLDFVGTVYGGGLALLLLMANWVSPLSEADPTTTRLLL